MTPEDLEYLRQQGITDLPENVPLPQGIPPTSIRDRVSSSVAGRPPMPPPNIVRQRLAPQIPRPPAPGLPPRATLEKDIKKKNVGLKIAELVAGLGADIAGQHGRGDAYFGNLIDRNNSRLDMFDKSEAAKSKAKTKGASGSFKDTAVLRKEYMKDDTTKRTKMISESMKRVYTAASKPSAANDLALIFNYMKILDPSSVVRESEFKNAEQARAAFTQVQDKGIAVPTFAMSFLQRIDPKQKGARMLPQQRKQFVDSALGLYNGQADEQELLYKDYEKLAKRYSLSPGDIALESTKRRKFDAYDPAKVKNDYSKMTFEEKKALARKRGLIK